MSINAVNDSIYQSQFSVLGGEEEEKGTFWIFWFKSCGMWHCLN